MADRTQYWHEYHKRNREYRNARRRGRYTKRRLVPPEVRVPKQTRVWKGFTKKEVSLAQKYQRIGIAKTLREARAIVRALRQQHPPDKADQYVR